MLIFSMAVVKKPPTKRLVVLALRASFLSLSLSLFPLFALRAWIYVVYGG